MKGFTLIETMVAITILMIAVSGPLYTAERAYIAALTARDQLTASFLAQEGIEYVRAMRDDEYLSYYKPPGSPAPSTPAWADFLSGGANVSSMKNCRNGTQCLLDPTQAMGSGAPGGNSAIQPCAGATCTTLNISNGIYTQKAGGTATSFKRTITVNDVAGNPNEVTVVVTVTWKTNHYSYTTTTSDHLTPWE